MPRLNSVLLALKELRKWRRREGNTRARGRVNAQIAYYEKLVSDMKKRIRPPKIVHLLGKF